MAVCGRVLVARGQRARATHGGARGSAQAGDRGGARRGVAGNARAGRQRSTRGGARWLMINVGEGKQSHVQLKSHFR